MPAGAPIGNSNASKSKPFLAAINRALEKRSVSDRAAALDGIVEKLFELAESGEQWAVQEIANRLDGKAAQQLIHSGDAVNPVRIVASAPDETL